MKSNSRVGIWLIGAKGGVASTAIVGLGRPEAGADRHRGAGQPAAAVSADLGWPIGAISSSAGTKSAASRWSTKPCGWPPRAGPRSPTLVEQCREELEQIDRRIRPGTIRNVGPTIAALADADVPRDETPRQAIARLGRDMAEFVRSRAACPSGGGQCGLDRAGRWMPSSLPPTWAELERLLDDRPAVSAAGQFALRDCGVGGGLFVHQLHAVARARRRRRSTSLPGCRGTRHYGCDGKTGETLMKSVLAPMFARRNLRVLSWVGHNIFGNMDGQVLDDPANKQSQGGQQGPSGRRNPRLPAANAGVDRVRARPGRLEDRLGPHPFRRFPRRADDAAIHLAGLRLGAGRPAGARPGAVHRVGAASRRTSARCPFWPVSSRAPTA